MVGAAGSRAPRAATARGAATGTGPICSLSVETLLSFSSLFHFIFLITFALTRERSTVAGRRRYLRGAGAAFTIESYVFATMNSECESCAKIIMSRNMKDHTHNPYRA